MTADDRSGFASRLALLAEVFNHPVSEVVAEAYFEVLQHYELDEVERAIVLVMKTSRFFPRPVEMLDYCREIRAARRAALAQSEREERRVLTESADSVNEAMGKFRDLVEEIAKKFTKLERPAKLRSVAEMNAEVERMREDTYGVRAKLRERLRDAGIPGYE